MSKTMNSITGIFNDPKTKVPATLLVIFAFVAGMYTSAYGLKIATAAGSIGGLQPDDIGEGFWFRYDLAGWAGPYFLNEGGNPYMIVTCEGVTTWAELGDAVAGASTRKAYEWSFDVYNSNGLVASALIDGNVSFNTAFTLFFQPMITAYENRSDINELPIYNRLRPYIDTEVLGWRTASNITRLSSANLGTVPYVNLPVGYRLTMNTTAFLGKNSSEFMKYSYDWTNQVTYNIAYDRDTGFLLYASVDVWYRNTPTTTTAYWMAMSLTGFGKNFGGTTLVGKGLVPPPPPSKPVVLFGAVSGKSYEAEIEIKNTDYDYSMINITSNNTNAFKSIVNLQTTAKVYPVDIDSAPVRLILSVINVRQGSKSERVEVMRIFNTFNAAPEVANVTLLSADAVGTSINASWTSNANASLYRVFINGTYYGDSTTGTSLLFNPPIGSVPSTGLTVDFNITVVVDSFDYNRSSKQSNGIIVSFVFNATQVDQIDYSSGSITFDDTSDETFVDFNAGAAEDTQQITFGIVLTAIGLVIAAVSAFVFFRTPTGKSALKKVSSVGTRKTDARCRRM